MGYKDTKKNLDYAQLTTRHPRLPLWTVYVRHGFSLRREGASESLVGWRMASRGRVEAQWHDLS